MKTTINLQDELIAENRKALAADQAVLAQQAALDAETDKLVNAALDRATADYETAKQKTLETLGLHYKLAEAKQVREKQSKWAHLPQERIFTKDAIKELCLKYNLRFLPTSYYKGALDSQLPDKLDELRKANGGLLPNEGGTMRVQYADLQKGVWVDREIERIATFSIVAPAESFALQPRPIDPLLFCNLGDDQYYLVHKWGSDISWSRRWLKHWRLVVHATVCATLNAAVAWFAYSVVRYAGGSAVDAAFISALTALAGGFVTRATSPSIGSSSSKTTNKRNWDSPYTS